MYSFYNILSIIILLQLLYINYIFVKNFLLLLQNTPFVSLRS